MSSDGERGHGRAPGTPAVPRPPVWVRLSRLPEIVVGGAALAAFLVGIIVYARDLPAESLALALGALALGAGAVGCAWFGRWSTDAPGTEHTTWLAWVGLAGATLAPFAALPSGADLIVQWNLTVFATCLMAVRGMRPWLSLIPAAGVFTATSLAQGADLAAAGVFTTTSLAQGMEDGQAIIAGASTLAFAAAGSAVAATRRYWEQVGLRAREAAEARDTAVARGIAEERVRIARDFHDLIGHEITVVNMHLGAAEVHLETDRGRARDDIAAARRSVQTVLLDTQRLLGLLRSRATGPADSATVAGCEQIPALVESFQAAGLEVEASLPDLPASLSPETDLAAARIVREMLTNAAKHGTGAASLTVTDDGTGLRISTANVAADQAGTAGDQVGYGVVGMRERASTLGGSLETRREGRLFWAVARLPYHPAQARQVPPAHEGEGP